MNFEIKNGDIIRFDFDDIRDWIAIHHNYIEKDGLLFNSKVNRNIKDQTGYFLFCSLGNDKDYLTSRPYCKCMGMLRRGHFGNITVVGNISNKADREKYKQNEKV